MHCCTIRKPTRMMKMRIAGAYMYMCSRQTSAVSPAADGTRNTAVGGFGLVLRTWAWKDAVGDGIYRGAALVPRLPPVFAYWTTGL